MKKVLGWIIAIIVVIIALVWFVGVSDDTGATDDLTVGVILPLSGPTAVWGEDFKRGIELALEDIGDDTVLTFLYEDSQGDPQEGISAYRKLTDIDKVDMVISLFSRVTIPLTELAFADQVPLFMSFVTATDAVSSENPYTFRVFSSAAQQGIIHFDIFEEEGYTKVGFLNLNDELGRSIAEVFNAEAARRGIEVIEELYLPGVTDYRTQLAKIKAADPDALVFVGIPPIALTNALQQSDELRLNVPVFENAGVLESPGARAALGEIANGVYSIATRFDVGETGVDFYERYINRFDESPSFGVAYGYDMTQLLHQTSQTAQLDSESFVGMLAQQETFDGLNGVYNFDGTGNILPEIFPSVIVNGEPQIIGGAPSEHSSQTAQ